MLPCPGAWGWKEKGLLAVNIADARRPRLTYSVPTSAKGEHALSTTGCLQDVALRFFAAPDC